VGVRGDQEKKKNGPRGRGPKLATKIRDSRLATN
jgi:hypothetical protein